MHHPILRTAFLHQAEWVEPAWLGSVGFLHQSFIVLFYSVVVFSRLNDSYGCMRLFPLCSILHFSASRLLASVYALYRVSFASPITLCDSLHVWPGSATLVCLLISKHFVHHRTAWILRSHLTTVHFPSISIFAMQTRLTQSAYLSHNQNYPLGWLSLHVCVCAFLCMKLVIFVVIRSVSVWQTYERALSSTQLSFFRFSSALISSLPLFLSLGESHDTNAVSV